MEAGNVFDGRYRLVKRIGLGGFSEVWLARDQMALDAEFALKIYKPKETLNAQAIQQFRQEFLQLINLAHPNVIRVYNYSIFEGMPYLVLPYFDRGNLSKLIQHRHLIDKSFLIDLFTQISEGLSYLHAKQIVHRDIKPDNILVSDDNTFVISDLGISDSLRETISLSNYKRDAVSVPYASPEMLSKDTYSDQKSDIFSFGVLMFEVITNSLPWNGIGGIGVQQPNWKLTVHGDYKNFETLINKCINPDSKNRPFAHEIAKMLKAKPKNIVPVKSYLITIGLLIFSAFGGFWFLNRNGPSHCEEYETYSEKVTGGLRWVRNDHNKYGFVNSDCLEVIPSIYEDALSFSDGLAPVKLNGKWGYIDLTGVIVIQPIYSEATIFVKNIAIVRDDTGVYKINTQGKRIQSAG